MLIETHDEWQDDDRRYLSEASMNRLYPDKAPLPAPAPTLGKPILAPTLPVTA